jgi:hypothetical protein
VELKFNLLSNKGLGMKVFASLVFFSSLLATYGQGTITFYNNGIARPFTTDALGNRTYTYDPNVDGAQPSDHYNAWPGHPLISADGSTYRAGIFFPGGFTGLGAAFIAGLFLTSDLSTPLATTTFRGNNTFEVFANNVPVTIPNAAVGSTQNFTIRVWPTGTTFENSVTRGEISFTSGPLGGPISGQPDAAPASLLGFNGFSLPAVPEPATSALGGFGLAALALAHRRRK